MNGVECQERILLRAALQPREQVHQDARGVAVDFVGDGGAVPAVLDLDPEQVAEYAVAGDEHVLALPYVHRGVVGSPGHDVAGHQSVAGANGKQAVDGIVLRSVVGNGEPLHASEMHTVDGEPADGEAADREALQHSGLRPAAGLQAIPFQRSLPPRRERPPSPP